MTGVYDQRYLREQQYRDSGNLDARIRLHARFSTNTYDWYSWVFDQYELPATCRILELGCGSADFWRKNAGRFLPGWELLLSDFSPGMLAKARQNTQQLGSISLLAVDAQAIPFDENTFDVVIANHMLYHLPDRPQGLREIRRVLKPGGRLYATTIGERHLQELLALPERFFPGKMRDHMQITNEFTLENGAEQLAPFFAHIDRRRYPDELRITEAAPLVEYIQSTLQANTIEGWPRFQAFIEEELDRSGGVIRVTKDSGIFIAS